MKLNYQQKILVNKLAEFIKGPHKTFLVEGIPGSGKTYAISTFLLKQKMIERENIIILTPTHQAKKVISKKTDEVFECSTIHSFLGLTKKITNDGKIYFDSENINSAFDETKCKYTLVVIDECSMINKKCFENLMSMRKRYDYKYIFIGDINQLPPINEEESLAFLIKNNFKLTQNMRNDNGIHKLCENILGNIKEDKEFFIEESENNTNYDNLLDYYQAMEKEVGNNSIMRVLCWTNKRRKELNKYVRSIKYGYKPAKYNLGEELVSLSTFTSINDLPINTNDVFKIEELSKRNLKVEELDVIPKVLKKYFKKIPEIQIWDLRLNDGFILYEITKKHKKQFLQVLEKIEVACKKYQKKKYWEILYKIKEYFLPEIDYAYSLTVHRSQGSEWDIVFLDAKDIKKNRFLTYKNKLFYVGSSRARQHLHVFK